MRTIWTSVALVLAAALLLPLAAAQQTNPEIRLTTSANSVQLAGNETSRTISVTVRNLGPAGGQVNLNVAPVDGWQIGFIEGTQFTLGSNAERTVTLRIIVLDTAKNATGSARVTATFSEFLSQREAQPVTSDVALTYIAPPLPPPPPPPPGTPWGMISSIAGAVLLGLFLFHTASVRLELSDSRLEVTPAGSGYVRVTVHHRWGPTRRVSLRVKDVPSPAVAALSLRSLRVGRGESVSVPLLVKAPVHMPDGNQSITVQARVGWIGLWTSRRRVRLTFRSPVAPEAPLQALPPRAPIILQN